MTRDNSRPVILVVAAALIDPDGRVLIAERPPDKAMAGLWEFPGGKVEAGETPETALIRELREELGIQVQAPCLAPFTFASHAYADFHLLMPLYICRRWEGTPAPREHSAIKWEGRANSSPILRSIPCRRRICRCFPCCGICCEAFCP